MSMEDLLLLRKYEPVIRYTSGELFFPCDIETYLKYCSLWQHAPDGEITLLASEHSLTAQKLASFANIPPEHTVYLRFVEEPIDGLDYQKWQREKPPFTSRGRLARVGLASRILDSVFDLSLLIRGKVPGGTTAAAHRQYQAIRADDPHYVYYGRVVREGGYIILNYIFFYVMNNWRSTFYGVNDHEADWEQIFVYLSDEGDEPPVPRWIAYATHEDEGDDLRRHWSDPTLTFVDETHPVVFAGAGSHASYFENGEYLIRFQLRFLEPLRNSAQVLRRFWTETLRQGNGSVNARLREQVDDFFSIPFLDYARGDGLSIGSLQQANWKPFLIDDDTDWVHQYRGLWGLDTQDPFGGERAPAGPKYNRDGTIRQSWHNPLGWSGLHKVSPPNIAKQQLQAHIAHLESQQQQLQADIIKKRDILRLKNLEVRALLATDYLDEITATRRKQLAAEAAELNQLSAQLADLEDTILASRHYLHELGRGNWGNPRAHITHERRPEPPQLEFNQAMEFWAALSSGLLFLMLALSFVITPGNWILRVVVIVAIFIIIESALRGQLAALLLNITLILAVISLAVLIIKFLPLVVLFSLLALARLLIVENWYEFRGR
ncbi:MAG: hypothetical protein Q9P01_01750 [Anaerolineae bacterium]|nr:hypothetical protein [Anaerolineae bacterium]MDQ7033586.1 hypothetical protein [Anaerolineae bacterium]